MFKRILVPLDGSSTSRRGLDMALRLARGQHATLGLVHVVDEHILVQYPEGAIATITEEFLAALRKTGERILARPPRRRDGAGCVPLQSS